MRLLLAFLLLAVSLPSRSQTDSVSIAGRVAGADGNACDGCIVAVLAPSDSSVVAYGMTDADGRYSVRFAALQGEVLVRLTGFNVKKSVQRVLAVSQALDFRAEEESMALREVQIKAQKMWGSRDTLDYLVAAYTKDHDRTIGDVLKELPGITIGEDGTIMYQGTPINHFYIENMDVLQGRYGLAAEGIRAEDVATVQVLENHEHVKALQDQMPPESAAINLRLKKKAKGVWTRNVSVGLGGDADGLLWQGSADVMYFGAGRQHFLHYGTDNTGTSGSARQHYGSNSVRPAALVGVLTPGSAPVGCSLRNNSHALNLNSLARLDSTRELRLNAGYSHDRQRRESFARTTYFLPDGGVTVVDEDIAACHTTNAADVQLAYEDNAVRKFVDNRLTLSGSWNEGRGMVGQLPGGVSQRASVSAVGIGDAVRWVRRTQGGGGFEMNGKASFQSSPQSLAVTGGMSARQDVRVTQASASFGFGMLRSLGHRRWTLSPDFSASGDAVSLSALHSALGGGNLSYWHAELAVGPVFRYAFKGLQVSFRTPATLFFTSACNGSLSPHSVRTGARLCPSASLLWKAGGHFTVSAGGRYSASETPWRQLVAASIMDNYRSACSYKADISDSHSLSADAKISFRDVFTGFFAYIEGSAECQWSDVIYGTAVGSDGHTELQAQHLPHHGIRYSASASLRKDIGWHNVRLELLPRWSLGFSRQLRQHEAVRLRSVLHALHASLAADVVEGCRFEYGCDWSRSRSVPESGTSCVIGSFSQRAAMHFAIVPKRLFANAGVSHSHNPGLQGRQDYAFLDAGLLLKAGRRTEWRLDCGNLSGTPSFVSRTSAGMTEHFVEYSLRPRSFMLSAAFGL